MMDQELKRAIIIEHYSKPRNHGLIEDDSYISSHSSSTTCIDDFQFQLKVDNGIIIDVRFDGKGCAISTAAISILSTLISKQKYRDALVILNQYKAMLNNENYDETILKEAGAFDTLYLQPNRLHCGSIGVDALISMIKECEQNDRK